MACRPAWKPKKSFEVHQTLFPVWGLGLGTRLDRTRTFSHRHVIWHTFSLSACNIEKSVCTKGPRFPYIFLIIREVRCLLWLPCHDDVCAEGLRIARHAHANARAPNVCAFNITNNILRTRGVKEINRKMVLVSLAGFSSTSTRVS